MKFEGKELDDREKRLLLRGIQIGGAIGILVAGFIFGCAWAFL